MNWASGLLLTVGVVLCAWFLSDYTDHKPLNIHVVVAILVGGLLPHLFGLARFEWAHQQQHELRLFQMVIFMRLLSRAIREIRATKASKKDT